MTSNLPTALREAHDLIATRGVARQRHYEEDTGALDMMGSLYFALPYRNDRETARHLIRAAVRELFPHEDYRKDFDISTWGDTQDQDTILAVMLRAAVIAERIPS